jgi:hypothetical protein
VLVGPHDCGTYTAPAEDKIIAEYNCYRYYVGAEADAGNDGVMQVILTPPQVGAGMSLCQNRTLMRVRQTTLAITDGVNIVGVSPGARLVPALDANNGCTGNIQSDWGAPYASNDCCPDGIDISEFF